MERKYNVGDIIKVNIPDIPQHIMIIIEVKENGYEVAIITNTATISFDDEDLITKVKDINEYMQ